MDASLLKGAGHCNRTAVNQEETTSSGWILCLASSVALSGADNIDIIAKPKLAMIGELSKVLKRLHYPLEVMLVRVRSYAAYPSSFRNLEEIMQGRGVFVDHSTVHRWALKILPVLARVALAVMCSWVG